MASINIPAAEAMLIEGLALHKAGLLAEAEAQYQQALAVQPIYFDALHLMGVVLTQTQRHKSALDFLARAAALQPAHPEASYNLGIVLTELGQADDALKAFDRALEARPEYAEAHCHRANLLKSLGQLHEALAAYDLAVQFKQDYSIALNNRGIALKSLGRLDAALASYAAAIACNPDYASAYCNRGLLLQQMGDPEAAMQSYARAIEIRPDFSEAYSNRGLLLKELGQLGSALQDYQQAIALNPLNAEAWSNQGIVLQELGQWAASIDCFDHAVNIKPDFADACLNRGLAHLQLGNYELGWIDYESRLKLVNQGELLRPKARPRWYGDVPLAGKIILLYAEQGLGDSLQFCRYASDLKRLGASVVLQVQPALAPLLRHLPDIDALILVGDALPDHDFHCPLLSLPLALETRAESIPCAARYLGTDKSQVEFWQHRLGPKTCQRIGVAWSGNMAIPKRSIPLAAFHQMLPAGYQYVSLQRQVESADLTALAAAGLSHFGESLDFAATAVVCDLMDVVVTVDTSIAHLAGALGKKVFILLPFNADWRWLLNRQDSPWYPTATLLRQHQVGDWSGVFADLAAALRGLEFAGLGLQNTAR